MTAQRYRAELEKQLACAGCEDAEFEAREIIRQAAGRFSPFEEIAPAVKSGCEEMLKRRLNGEPLQYIFGSWEFYGYTFSVGRGVLIPRPETEQLCELAIKHLKISRGKAVDLCSGSGCIAVAVSLEADCAVTAVELYNEAYSYLEKNIRCNGADRVTPLKADVMSEEAAAHFENNSLAAVISNPPYISEAQMKALQKEVLLEPHTALCGGEDGLDFYRRIMPLWTPKLYAGGLMAVETGEEQGRAVSEIFSSCGLSPDIIKDYSGHDRIVYAVKGGK